ncbi:ubiquinone biosynthesis O-methyltransferase, mitochondrial isoform X2 [Agrilus planipennis]|uniref:Ubiquinone biosynthesis O-methyltransferase, mitochondrial n=1 Tax=Agrilus planipennis TaxID=224129 RepID=A0A1W4XDV8_AGRPL|nr:ubiquinone biosynthesis O-methyltransferase, mitochondrial isoform X2 [Agrilus planipennis]
MLPAFSSRFRLFKKYYSNRYENIIITNYLNCSTNTSIDKDEEVYFKKHSTEWWNKMGDMKPLHSMNKVRVPFIRNGLINTGLVQKDNFNNATPLKDLFILDVGCGGGILSEAMARLGANVTGIDDTKDLIEIATSHAALKSDLNNLQYIKGTIADHAQQSSNKYDAVVLSEVIEHIKEKDKFLEACVNCIKPGGSIFITTISKTNISWAGAIVFAEQFKLIPSGTHQWDKFILTHHLQRLLEDYNCRTCLIHGLAYNPLMNSWHWTKNTMINYALHAVKDV